MKMNRFIYIVLIIASGVFASFYGGNFSHALFYLSILLPVISFLYTLYVYFSFKLYQTIDSRVIVKGDWTEYSFVVANEDFVTFRNIKVKFLSDKSTIDATNQTNEYSLLPGEKERLETRMKCNYRGEYYVGVDSIEVTDFLYLFTITYPISTKLKAFVLPRVVQLEQLAIAPPQIDVKKPFLFSNTAQEELDTEVRKYAPGDARKRIHWKASAKMQELISRKYQYIPKAEIVIFMDMTKIDEEDLKVVIVEDKIIESALAISNYYMKQKTASKVIYDSDGIKQVTISSKEEFNAFYKSCAAVRFQGTTQISRLIQEKMLHVTGETFCVAATHYLTKEFYMTALQLISNGSYVSILFISDDNSEENKRLIDTMKESGINVYQVLSEDEIGNILSNGSNS